MQNSKLHNTKIVRPLTSNDNVFITFFFLAPFVDVEVSECNLET